jgi:hypothetical protein
LHSFREERLEVLIDFPLVDSARERNDGPDQFAREAREEAKYSCDHDIELMYGHVVSKIVLVPAYYGVSEISRESKIRNCLQSGRPTVNLLEL